MKESEIQKWKNHIWESVSFLLDLPEEELSDKLVVVMEDFIERVRIEKAELEKELEKLRKKCNINQGEKK